MAFELPPREQVGYPDPEILAEGEKVVGELAWNPPPPRPVIPDMSQIKSIRHYFGRTGYQVFPAWLYHQNGEERLVRNAANAAALGVKYRDATIDERGRYGVQAVWDWTEDSLWRPKPWALRAFDPAKPTHGKNYIAPVVDAVAEQQKLLAALTQAIQSGGVQKPPDVSDKDWAEFQQFLEFKRMQAAAAVATAPKVEGGAGDLRDVSAGLQSFADKRQGEQRRHEAPKR